MSFSIESKTCDLERLRVLISPTSESSSSLDLEEEFDRPPSLKKRVSNASATILETHEEAVGVMGRLGSPDSKVSSPFAQGAMGRTLLGTVESLNITEKKTENVVLKLVKYGEGEIEAPCAKMIRHFGISSPHTQLIENEKEKLHFLETTLSDVVKEWSEYLLNDRGEALNLNEVSVLFMDFMEGETASQFFLSHKFQNASPATKYQIMKEFGMLVAIDIFLGNADRLLDWENDFSAIRKYPISNLNNLLIETSSGNANTVSAIDNAPLFAVEENDSFEGADGFFDCSSYNSGGRNIENLGHQFFVSKMEEISNCSFAGDWLTGNIIEGIYNEIVRVEMERIISLENNTLCFADPALRELAEKNTAALEHELFHLKEYITQGLFDGYQRLLNPEVQEHVLRIADGMNNAILKSLIEQNIGWLQKPHSLDFVRSGEFQYELTLAKKRQTLHSCRVIQ